MQSRTHTCGELRMEHVGQKVQLAGWMENVREVGGSLAFVVVRDFYGKTQLVVENEDLLRQLKGINKESTIGVIGTVRERASKNPNIPTGDIEVVPEKSRPVSGSEIVLSSHVDHNRAGGGTSRRVVIFVIVTRGKQRAEAYQCQ